MGAQAEVSITPAPPHPEPCGNLPAQLRLFISRAVAAKGMYLAPNYKQFGGCKGIALPLLQYCICAGCSTYTCLSRQVPGFLLLLLLLSFQKRKELSLLTAVVSFPPWPTLSICSHALIERVILLVNPYLKYRIQPLKFFKSNFLSKVTK